MRRVAFVVCVAAMAAFVAGCAGGPEEPAGSSEPAAPGTPGASEVEPAPTPEIQEEIQEPLSARPTMVIETAKGAIEVRLFRDEAPESVDHIISLVQRNFYRSQRFHRAEATIVQFGDPQSRDMTKQDYWGAGSSFNPIGVAEIGTRKHVRGTVGLAHSGNATLADSQIYIMKAASPSLDGKHTIIGEVISGMSVVDQLERTDILKLVAIK